MLDPAIDFLNHGSFGALPRRVAAAQDRWRAFLEARPIERLGRGCRDLLATPRRRVAELLGAAPEEIGFVVNATEAINAVLRSLAIAAGDELVTTDHVYNAVRQSLRFVARRAGARVIEVPIPLPREEDDAVVARIEAQLGPRTRLVVVDHVSSPTALRMPVEALAALCRRRGVPLLVDGAHGPGMLPIALRELGATWYAANLHKWICAPKGSAFLWAAGDAQSDLHPATISHFLDEGFVREFDWQGTRDISGWLSVPDAIDFLDDRSIGLGLDRVMAHNHALAVWAQELLARAWRTEPLSPLDGRHLGAMATVELPRPLAPGCPNYRDFLALQEDLVRRHGIEAPIVQWNSRWFVRPCCQVYNRPEQYGRLAEAVLDLAGRAGG